MRERNVVGPTARIVRDELEFALEGETGIDVGSRYVVRRLVEMAYGEGYSDGHLDGRKEAAADVYAKREREQADETEGAI